MKCKPNITILFFYLMSVCLCLKGITFRRSSASVFRVLMTKNYVEDIGDFLLSFLKTSKIDKNVKSLSNCLQNITNTLSALANATKALNEHPNLLTIMALISNIDRIYKDAKNSKICTNITKEFKSYLDSYINETKIAPGEYTKYFEDVSSFFEDNYRKFYFKLKKAMRLYSNNQASKAGEVMGNFLRDFLKMRDFDVNYKDTFVIRNSKFESEAKLFKRNIVYCEFAIGELIPDFLKFFQNTTKSDEVVPNANDLIKSLSEATKIFKCIDGIEKIKSFINE